MTTKHPPHQTNLKTLPDGTYTDSDVTGLYFVVEGASRYFVYRFKIGAERPWMRLGTIAEITLAKARELVRGYAYDLKRNGVDPRAKRNASRDGVDFKSWCDEALPGIVSHLSPKEQEAWARAVKVVPTLHRLQLHAIQAEHVEAALKPIWAVKPPTATKTRQVLFSLFKVAKARKLRTGDNPAAWEDGLKERAVLKPFATLHTVRNHPSLPFAQVPALMLDLSYDPATSARVLELIILCAGRSQEVRRMEVRELDLDNARWTIPAKKIKARRDHVVALPPRVVELLRAQLRRLPKDAKWVFPTDAVSGGNEVYGDNGIRNALRKRGLLDAEGNPISVHGMRSSFRTWATKTPVLPQMQREAAEFALAHKVYGATEGAYARDTLEDERLPLMAAWADHCLSLVPSSAPQARPAENTPKVVLLRTRRAA